MLEVTSHIRDRGARVSIRYQTRYYTTNYRGKYRLHGKQNKRFFSNPPPPVLSPLCTKNINIFHVFIFQIIRVARVSKNTSGSVFHSNPAGETRIRIR